MTLGKRLKKQRELRGWSQLYVANRIGISNTVLSNYERDYRDPDTETLRILAELYEVSTDYLLGNNDAGNLKESNASHSASDGEKIANLPEVQFIMRAKEEMSEKAYAKFLKHIEVAKAAYVEDDEE